MSTGELFSRDSVFHVESRNIDNRNRVDRCTIRDLGFQSESAETVEHGRLSLTVSDNVPMTLNGATPVWCGATTRDIPLPPSFEVLIQGGLKVTTQKKVLAPEEVIVQPVELNILGVRVARMLSKVGKDISHVVLKAINFSKEKLILPNICTLAITESHRPRAVDRNIKRCV